MSKVLTRADFCQKYERQLKHIKIPDDVPGLGGKTVIIQAMSPKEKAVYETQFTNKNGTLNREKIKQYRELLAIETVVDEDGNKIFQKSDVQFLSEMPLRALEIIVKATEEMNNVSKDDFEELEKNFGETG